MNRPVAAFVLMLALLLQGLASAWAAPMTPTRAAQPASREAAMPCHADADADADAAAASARSHKDSGMSCCDDPDHCTHCDAVCGTHPSPPAATVQLDDYLDAHYTLMRRTDTVLLAPPLDLLRPPITLLR